MNNFVSEDLFIPEGGAELDIAELEHEAPKDGPLTIEEGIKQRVPAGKL